MAISMPNNHDAILVSAVMTEDVTVVHPDTKITEAIRTMLDRNISGLPVLDHAGKVVGIFSEGDVLRRAELGTEKTHSRWVKIFSSQGRLAQEYVATHAREVRDVMTPDVICVSPRTSLEEAVGLMEKHHIKRLPVLRQGRLVGILSRVDLLKALLDYLTLEVAASDVDIRRCITEEVQRQAWASGATLQLAVERGVVDLEGNIDDERLREALRVIALNVPGVRKVHDHLVFVDPATGVETDAPAEEGIGRD